VLVSPGLMKTRFLSCCWHFIILQLVNFSGVSLLPSKVLNLKCSVGTAKAEVAIIDAANRRFLNGAMMGGVSFSLSCRGSVAMIDNGLQMCIDCSRLDLKESRYL
jgi:hypothetical protein